LFSLPSYSTLQRYIGPSNLKEGFTQLIKRRLEEEIKQLKPAEKFCTIMFDEMSIKPQVKFVRQVGRVIGKATLWNRKKHECAPLANRLLCFVVTGLSTHYRIPVSYFLTRDLDGAQQLEVLKDTISKLEEIGFKVVRAVCDCISFNVKTFLELCGNEIQPFIPHPCDPSRLLYISFDPCHVIKNLRNQFMDKKRAWINCGKRINSDPIRILYAMQKNNMVKLVRYLSRKMVYPTPFEKMNVSRAVRLFSSEMSASLELQQEQKQPGFMNISGTLEFMALVRKWFNHLDKFICDRVKVVSKIYLI